MFLLPALNSVIGTIFACFFENLIFAMNRFLIGSLLLAVQHMSAQPISWITPCENKVFCLNFNSCNQGQVFLTEKAVTNCGNPNINYSYKIDLNSDFTIDIQSSDDTVSGNFPKGIHEITWRATDNCGKLAQCTYRFEVKDCQPPNLLCVNGLTQQLSSPICENTFFASQFILSLTDNCTPTNQIELGIRKAGTGSGFPTTNSITFGKCDKGLNLVEVWARDANGITNNCGNYVLVQDDDGDCVCNNDADVYLNGCAQTGGGQKINEFRLKAQLETLPGAATPLTKNYSRKIVDSCFTGHLDKIPFGNSYQVVIGGENKLGHLVGVTTFDLVLISKHILGTEPFTSVYQTVAADVNKSGSVTTFDIVETRKLILGIYDTFPLVPAWRFSRPVADPSQVANFAALKDTYQITLHNLVDDVTLNGFHFVGIKYGDVNGTASLQSSADERFNAPPVILHAPNPCLKAGEEISLPITLDDEVSLEGWQLALAVDPNLIQITGVEGLPSDNYHLNNNTLRLVWADGNGRTFKHDEAFFSLKIKLLKPAQLSSALRTDPETLRPEAYSNASLSSAGRHPLALVFGAQQRAAEAVFYSPRPNPFSQETAFDLMLTQPGSVLLEVFDLTGRMVHSRSVYLDAGLQTLHLSAEELPVKGVLPYRLSVGNSISRGRVLKI